MRGSFRIGRFILSGQIGVNAGEHRFASDLIGVPDSIGLLMGKILPLQDSMPHQA